MKRPLRSALVFIAALLIVPFLPLYVQRTMMRSWRMDRAGDMVEWGWKICTLESYWSNYSRFSREQNPALWLGVNLSLAFIYALVITLVVNRVLARLKGHEGRIR